MQFLSGYQVNVIVVGSSQSPVILARQSPSPMHEKHFHLLSSFTIKCLCKLEYTNAHIVIIKKKEDTEES